jgi:hypothetical protein
MLAAMREKFRPSEAIKSMTKPRYASMETSRVETADVSNGPVGATPRTVPESRLRLMPYGYSVRRGIRKQSIARL